MYLWLEGIVDEIQDDYIVLNVNGIGFQLLIKKEMREDLPMIGEHARIYTYFNVREDVHELYAFTDCTQRALFIKLISISGIGPKVALGMLAAMRASDLALAIISSDVKKLTNCPGIGKKTAERIILELKEKVDNFTLQNVSTALQEESSCTPTTFQDEAIQVLIALGYDATTAKDAVFSVSMNTDTNLIVKQALKIMASK